MRVLLLVPAMFALAACPALDRQLDEAQIRLVATRDDGKPAAHAVAFVGGSERFASANKDGAVLLNNVPLMAVVLRVVEDEDGDGVYDRGAFVPVQVQEAEVKRVGGAAAKEILSFDLGTIELTTTRTVSGEVTHSNTWDPAGTGTVYAFHTIAVGDTSYTQMVESSAWVDATGAFILHGVMPGAATLVASAFDEGDRFIGTTDIEDEVSTATIAADDDADVGGTLATVSLQVEVGAVKDRENINDVLAQTPNTTAVVGDASAVGEGVDHPGGAFGVTLPVGIFDVAVSADGLSPVLHGAPIVAGVDVLAPIELRDALVCLDDANDKTRDCDGDGLTAQPSLAEDATVAADCAAACSDAVLDDASCESGGDTYDCDDDGDGAADASEADACRGAGRGRDDDGDGLCDLAQDLFPGCAQNDPALCN